METLHQREISLKHNNTETQFGYQIKNRKEFGIHLTQMFGGMAGNSINYVADIIRAEAEEGRESVYTVEENLFTAVVEHPMSESVTEYKYELDWQEDEGEMKLVTDFGTLDDIYKEGVENESGQIPEFERQRNIKNKQLYEKLKKYRSEGNYSPVVEFSPSPEMTEEAKERGYKGNDAVFIYEYEDGKEKVTQHWIDKQSMNEYQELIKTLDQYSGLPRRFKNYLNDLDVMDASDIVNQEQYDVLMDFIDERKPDIDTYKDKVIEYAQNIIRPKIKAEVYPLVQELAKEIVNGGGHELYVKEKLKEISDNMARFQLELYILTSNRGDVTLDDYIDMTTQDQVDYMTQIAFEMTGCGISETISVSTELFGRSSGMVADAIGMSENAKVICKSPACAHYWYVINGNQKTYKSSCPACGENMKC